MNDQTKPSPDALHTTLPPMTFPSNLPWRDPKIQLSSSSTETPLKFLPSLPEAPASFMDDTKPSRCDNCDPSFDCWVARDSCRHPECRDEAPSPEVPKPSQAAMDGTPRSDLQEYDGQTEYVVSAKFSRQLERELNEARALHVNAIDLLNSETLKLDAANRALETKRAELAFAEEKIPLMNLDLANQLQIERDVRRQLALACVLHDSAESCSEEQIAKGECAPRERQRADALFANRSALAASRALDAAFAKQTEGTK